MVQKLLWLVHVVWLTARVSFRLIAWVLKIVHTLHRWGGFNPGGALGSARFASRWELLWSGVRRGNGPIVGRKGRSFLRFNKDGMITVFAPMGAGKGVGVVIPNLLEYRGSIVCTDIKGENSAITRRRREQMGVVRVLDTTNPEASDHFNPLDHIRVGSFHERDDAEALARLMIVPDDKSGHWDAKAEGLLACLILHVMRLEPERRNLAQVRTLSTLPPESLKELLRTISTSGPRAAAEIAASFLSMDGSEEFRSVLSNTEKATRVWTAGGPAGEISRYSDCDLGNLVRQVKTIYLVVDEEKLDIYAGFLRVMVGSVINALTRAKNQPRPKDKVLLLLDEAAALGNLEPLERGVGYLRAYCTPLLVFQDMSQLRAIYRRAGSFLANATCKVFFNVADLDAARFVSEIIGQTTSLSRNAGVSHSSLDLLRQHHSLGQSEAARWLLDPSEIMRLPGRRAIVIYRSDILRHPVLASKVNYRSWRNLRWRGLYDTWPATRASRAVGVRA
ncbi:type IV secretory system conjugative DNA transfer family protein [Bradyrhizobium japonicum]|uniref:type IV secretory system conjugative DNA transfer family protein n=1 Tax=Bradyrhizobium japonicum TaxID=375 RepID=UPI002714CA73|nr:type IV secretory system conjugative DNA transfer family protein [Bradyrhizobium japonicum]WLB57444.1 type IV secretory system conjugative DNA transfer family protein [Bradyrhizobium japonicum]